MKILVTGASGFVGTHLVRELSKNQKDEVHAAVFGQGSTLTDMLMEKNIHSGDLTNADWSLNLIQDVHPDLIYHLAALSVVQDSVEKAGKVLTDNLRLQYNILESVRVHSPNARIVAICSANEYGLVKAGESPVSEDNPLRPLNPYAVSKVAQDMLAYQYFLAYGLDIVRLRPFNHTGVGQTTDFVIPALAKQFAAQSPSTKNPAITVGNTDTIRDFTDVEDMVNAYVVAAEKCEKGEVYNIGTGVGVTVGDIIHEFEKIAGFTVTINTDANKRRPSDVPTLIADASKFRAATNWEPQIAQSETLTKVYNYMKEQNNV